MNYAYNTGMEWAQTWTIIGVIAGLVAASFFILRSDIKKSEDYQDKLRKSELEPIKEQVNNHLPTEIKESKTELQASIKESKDELKASIEKLEKLI